MTSLKTAAKETNRLRVVKPKQLRKYKGRSEERKVPWRANENSKKNQATLLKRGKTWDDQVIIGVSYESDWLREWRSFLDQSQRRVKEN